MRTADAVVTCSLFVGLLGKLEQTTSSYFKHMYTQGLIIRMRVWESKYEIGTPSEKKCHVSYLVFFFFSCNWWLTRDSIMNEEVVTKMPLGIGWWRLMADSQEKGKHQLCHLSCNPLTIHGKRHYFSTFSWYWNMGVPGQHFIFYTTLLNHCAFRAYILYPLVIQHNLFVNWIDGREKRQGGSLKHWDNHPLVAELG